jgi:nitrogen regulatory protein PII-like uncharacterized protein
MADFSTTKKPIRPNQVSPLDLEDISITYEQPQQEIIVVEGLQTKFKVLKTLGPQTFKCEVLQTEQEKMADDNFFVIKIVSPPEA